MSTDALGGRCATAVRRAPKGILMLALALIAQPFASRIGPRLRLRSLIYARMTDGNETRSIAPANTRGSCDFGNFPKNARTVAPAVARLAKATLASATTLGSNLLLAPVAVANAPTTAAATGAKSKFDPSDQNA